jgi:hypothetical protein
VRTSSPTSRSLKYLMSEPNPERRVVRCRARLELQPTDDGGIRQPLTLPTQSIVFKFTDGPLKGAGTLAIIAVPGSEQLSAGTEIDADVIFPDAPPDEDFRSRRFSLWTGREVGTATVAEIDGDSGPTGSRF